MTDLENTSNVVDTDEYYYRVSLYGYGGEIVFGASTEAEYEYWYGGKAKSDIQIEDGYDDGDPLSYYVLECDSNADQFPNVPEEFRRVDGWYDQDDLAHVNGVNYTSAYISIEQLDSPEWDANIINEVVSIELPKFVANCGNTVDTEIFETDLSYVFLGVSVEKGEFFSGIITTAGPIDMSKLSFYTTEYPTDDNIVHAVTYDHEDIENTGGDTNGKSMIIEILDL